MRTGGRRWAWAVGLALIGALLAFSAGRWQPREQLLLQRATRVANAQGFDRWVSDQEIVCDLPRPINAANQPTLARYNVRTGNERSFVIKQYPTGTHGEIMPSPDGWWTLCWDTTGASDKITAQNLQTGHCFNWPAVGDLYHYPLLWMADSHRWVSIGTLPEGYLLMYTVDKPDKAIKLPFPSSRRVWFQDYTVTASDHFFALDYGGNETASIVASRCQAAKLYLQGHALYRSGRLICSRYHKAAAPPI